MQAVLFASIHFEKRYRLENVMIVKIKLANVMSNLSPFKININPD